jgi:F0F1-type ATP synthase membrane subunit c/vacuolar-type H+-ATPase subunit K
MGPTDSTTGYATLAVPAGQSGFDGFWQSQPMGGHATLNFSNIPVRNDVQVDQRQEWDANAIRNALGPAGVQWDTTKAIILFQVEDCRSALLHQDAVLSVKQSTAALGLGVAVTIAPSASGIVPGYFVGGMLAASAKQTDASGRGGFVDVPQGSITLTAKVVATGQTLGTAHVVARAGSVANVTLAPSP